MLQRMINIFSELIIHIFLLILLAYNVHAQQGIDVSYAKEDHKILGQFAGHWKQLYKHNPIGSKTPSYGKGETVNLVLYKGVYIEMNGRLLYTGGVVVSKTIIGYDSNLKKYFLLSYDSVGLLPLVCQGEYDPETNRFSFVGEKYYSVNAPTKIRVEIYFERPDKYYFEFYRTDDNNETKVMSIANIKKN